MSSKNTKPKAVSAAPAASPSSAPDPAAAAAVADPENDDSGDEVEVAGGAKKVRRVLLPRRHMQDM
jgi:hypothetical protein